MLLRHNEEEGRGGGVGDSPVIVQVWHQRRRYHQVERHAMWN